MRELPLADYSLKRGRAKQKQEGKRQRARKGNHRMSSEENKAIVRRLFEEVLNEGRLTAIDELVATDYLSHAGAPRRKDFKQVVIRLRAGFPDLRYTIEDLIAEGDKVVIRATMHGTHGVDYLGIPPTGKRVTSESIHIVRLASGKFREHWAQGSNLRQQLIG
jgi:predicted ester cyclase